MGRRLTPYFRRQVLELPLEDRLELIRDIERSLGDPQDGEERLAGLGTVLGELTGADLRERCRRKDLVRARAVFVAVARAEGYSQLCISRYLGLNHSTVCYLEKRMTEAFTMPGQFGDYIDLYNSFTQKLILWKRNNSRS